MASIRGGREGSGSAFPRSGQPYGDEQSKEKALRSIFVANIAFETTDEQLRGILSEVGPVINLKLIYDPATGKPRGFGFCEYEDSQTALSAVRNLAGRELNGRPLRIDSATNAPGGDGSKGPPPPPGGPASVGLVPGPIEPRVHGPPVPPESAPEVITKAVASLPPEQMFELMKQMKWFISHNPQEARQLLLHNPQLAYALLQAQVVMKVVDLETAQNILHRTPRGPPLIQLSPGPPQHRPPPTDIHHHPPQRQAGPFHGPPPRGEMDRGHYNGPRPPPPQEHFGGPMRGHPPGPDVHGGRYNGPPPRGPPGDKLRPPPDQTRSPQLPSGGGAPSHEEDMTQQEQQKAALIMQVLSLSDDQIQMLPPDQRTSILKLKEQIARTGP